MASPAAILNIVITANASAAQAQLARTQAQMKAVAATADKSALATAGAWQKTGNRMNAIGKTLTRTVTLPALAVGAASVKMAMDFEHSMSLIQTQAGASGKEVQWLTKQVMDFAASGKSTHGPDDLAKALYHIESSGYRTAKAMKILRASEALATTGGADMEQTTNALVGAMRSGIKGTENLTRTVGSLNAIVGAGNMRMDELTAAMGTGLMKNAKQMGLSLNQVGAAIATMTRQGMPATQSATRLTMALRMMMSPTDKASKALQSIGLSASKLGTMMQAGNFPGAIHLLAQRLAALGDSPEALQKKATVIREMFGARSASGINAILDSLQQYDSTLKQVNQKSADFNRLHAAAMQTPANRLRAIWAQLQTTLIKLGETLTPIVLHLAKAFQKVASAVGSLPSWLVEGVFLGAIVIGPMARLVGWVFKLAAAWKAVAAAQAVSGAAGVAGAAGGGAAGRGGASAFQKILGSRAAQVGAGAAGGVALGPLASAGIIAAPAVMAAGGGLALSKSFGQSAMGDSIKQNEKLFTQAIARMAAADHGLTLAHAHEIRQRAIQYANEHKVSAEWAKGTVEQMNNTVSGSQRLTKVFAQMGAMTKNNFAGMGKAVDFEMGKITNAMITGKDVVGQLKASYGALERRIGKAMESGAISVDKGTKLINKLVAQEMAALGMAPIKGGAFTMPSKLHGPHPNAPGGGKPTGPTRGQRGGFLPGPTAGDRIPLLAEGGEFMVNAKATKRFLPLLERINKAVPRFAGGGVIPTFRGTAPGVIDDIAAASLNKEAEAARRLLRRARAAAGPRGGGASFGPGGVGSYMGVTMANWVIQALMYAAKHGSGNPQPTSGYRPWDKDSEHSGTRYPHGAVDFGGYTTGGAAKMRVVNATRGFKFPLLAPIGFSDAGHASGTGHQRGGLVSGNWNKNQLTTLAAYVGMKNPALMAAIAMAESRGNPSIRGVAGEYGLWQIMPSWGGGRSLLDPIKNARKARYILGKQGLGAWTTWRTGAYKHFLGGHVKAGLMNRLRGGTTGKTGATTKHHPKAPKPYSTDPYDAVVAAIDARNEIIGTINDLIGQGNLASLQRYQTGLAQNPLLGIPSPGAPNLTPYRPSLAYPPKPSGTASGPYSGGISFGLTAHPPPEVHNHFYIDGKEIRGVTKVEMRKAARKGRRRLPSGRR